MDTDDFRAAASRLAAGVVVVSASGEGGHRGLTATTFAIASLDPPLVLVCLDRLSATGEALVDARRFNVSLLAAGQEFIADRFAGRGPAVQPDWREIPHTIGDGGIPVVRGCSAWFGCRLRAVHPAGDHEIMIGAVESVGLGTTDPLVHWNRSFWALNPS